MKNQIVTCYRLCNGRTLNGEMRQIYPNEKFIIKGTNRNAKHLKYLKTSTEIFVKKDVFKRNFV